MALPDCEPLSPSGSNLAVESMIKATGARSDESISANVAVSTASQLLDVVAMIRDMPTAMPIAIVTAAVHRTLSPSS